MAYPIKKFSAFSLFLGFIGYQGGLDVNAGLSKIDSKHFIENLPECFFVNDISVTPGTLHQSLEDAKNLSQEEQAVADFILCLIQNDAAHEGENLRERLKQIDLNAENTYTPQQQTFAGGCLFLATELIHGQKENSQKILLQLQTNIHETSPAEFYKIRQIADGNCCVNAVTFKLIYAILFHEEYSINPVTMDNLWLAMLTTLDIVASRGNPLLKPYIEFVEHHKHDSTPTYEELKTLITENCKTKEQLDAATLFFAPALRQFGSFLATDRLIKINESITDLKIKLQLATAADNKEQITKITKDITTEQETYKSIIRNAGDRVWISPAELLPIATKLGLNLKVIGKTQVTSDNSVELLTLGITNPPMAYIIPSNEDKETALAGHWDTLVTLLEFKKLQQHALIGEASIQTSEATSSYEFQKWIEQQLESDQEYKKNCGDIDKLLDQSDASEKVQELLTKQAEIAKKYQEEDFLITQQKKKIQATYACSKPIDPTGKNWLTLQHKNWELHRFLEVREQYNIQNAPTPEKPDETFSVSDTVKMSKDECDAYLKMHTTPEEFRKYSSGRDFSLNSENLEITIEKIDATNFVVTTTQKMKAEQYKQYKQDHAFAEKEQLDEIESAFKP